MVQPAAPARTKHEKACIQLQHALQQVRGAEAVAAISSLVNMMLAML